MVVVGVCVLMLASGKKLRFTFGMGSLALVAALTLQHFFGQAKTFNLNSMQKLQSHENTREQVFRAQFASFCEYPVMGRPFQPGTRCRFGESSWLGAAGHTGLCGLVPMVMAACGVLFQWLRIRRANRSFRNEWLMPFVVAGVLMLLTGSFLEAYLLGVVTFPIFWTLAFLVTMDHCYRRLLAQRVALPLTLQSSPLLASYLQPLDR